MKKIKFNGIDYEVIVNERDAIDEKILDEMVTDYFDNFTYILGDWAYGKLRLKGFYDADDKNVSEINNIDNYKEYVEKYCAYGCRYFLLKKL